MDGCGADSHFIPLKPGPRVGITGFRVDGEAQGGE